MEWPTLALIAGNYSLWGIALLANEMMPTISVVLMCFVLTIQSSIVHELIHGHPTRNNTLNLCLGIVPLTLWYPIHLFKETHLKHHENMNLTIPNIDPESYFHHPVSWQEKTEIGKLYAFANMTLIGRLLFAVPSTLFGVLQQAAIDLRSGTKIQRIHWLVHFSLVLLLFAFIVKLESMSLIVYITCAAIAHSIISLRSFFEHRPALDPMHRSVIVKSNFVFQLLFLNNNFHAVHHRHPGLPWYRLSNLYEATKHNVLKNNQQFYFSGYSKWLRFLFSPIHPPVHPGPLDR